MTLIAFESIPIQETHEPLVNLADFGFGFEPVYFKQKISSEPRIFLRESVAKKLFQAQAQLKMYKIKIWDGYRPRDVQRKIHQAYLEQLKSQHPNWSNDQLTQAAGTFITSPDRSDRIPPHATGGAVDLTLTDGQGTELNMGTAFDYFGAEAAALYYEKNNLSETIQKNRKILRDTLLAEDFCFNPEEWWHFDYGNQLWAVGLNKPRAMYGEIALPPT